MNRRELFLSTAAAAGITLPPPIWAMPPQAVEHLPGRLMNLTTAHIGAGGHFLQEDTPQVIAPAIGKWMETTP
ncbi:hypothetical protein AIOL_001994 [Candidatus Rhodobacter oscarellae]|uniref:Epoxide hydrolase n=1 Tax=Candidatus Rhodobacter oscarellae TaxID=1675527 RepID=A0A0J9E2E9_9RHOB|nr:hypothetical protein [Candidatus Rhodobacter lobularis]KMW57036.1 hypothetical protein AIOL_001994 [Candidatus Rhodobacter lobularis]